MGVITKQTVTQAEIDHILIGMITIIGYEGEDWNYLVSWPPYWRVWGKLNRN